MVKKQNYQNLKKIYVFRQLLIDKGTYEELRREAKRAKTTISELMRIYIEWGLEITVNDPGRRK